jgi:menaquinone-dependent protoporphyrinogen oxidase
MRTLTVYASAHGSTAEVGRFIADILKARGIDSDAAAAGSASPDEAYDAYILGSAVHHGLWLPEMAAFARQLRGMVSDKPVYLWLSCVRVLEPDGYACVTNNYLPNFLPRPLSFRRIGVFAGAVDRTRIGPNDAWTLTFRYDGKSDPFALGGDHRDWNAIRAWAEQVADDLVPGSAPRTPGAAPASFG